MTSRDAALDAEFDELSRKVETGQPLTVMEAFLYARELERRRAVNPLLARPVQFVAAVQERR